MDLPADKDTNYFLISSKRLLKNSLRIKAALLGTILIVLIDSYNFSAIYFNLPLSIPEISGLLYPLAVFVISICLVGPQYIPLENQSSLIASNSISTIVPAICVALAISIISAQNTPICLWGFIPTLIYLAWRIADIKENDFLEARNKQDKQLVTIETVISTMPGADAFKKLSEASIACRRTLRKLEELLEYNSETPHYSSLKTGVIEQIQGVLGALAAIAKSWDEDTDETPYHANIFLSTNSKHLTKDYPNICSQAWDRGKMYVPEGISLDTLANYCDEVLIVEDGKYSIIFENESPATCALEPLLIPVSIKDDYKKPSIPGAGEAFDSGRPQYIEDVKTHFQDVLEDFLTPGAITAINDYFASDKRCASIISLPLKIYNGNQTEASCLGAVNIYRPRAKMVKGKVEMYYNLVIPLLIDLVDLLLMEAEIDSRINKSTSV